MTDRFSFTRDDDTGAVYVQLTNDPSKLCGTIHISDSIMIDVDADGNPIGVEVL